MFTVKKAEKLLDIILNDYPSLKDENIKIIEGNEFSVNIGLFCNTVSVVNKINDDIFNKFIRKYLLKKDFDTNCYVFNNLYEVFSFIHEIGHVYYKRMRKENEVYYNNYKTKIHDSYMSAFYLYREIPFEALADEFAINIIKNNAVDIWAIMNDISKEDAREEYNFWNLEE